MLKQFKNHSTHIIISCCLLFTIFLSSCSITAENKNAKEQSSQGKATFLSVIDGDTFEAVYRGKVEKIRLADIDCFEISEGDRLKSQAKRKNISTKNALNKGKEAEEKLANILMHNNVLYVIPIKYDRYRRLLAYVYAGNLNVNQYMRYEAGCDAYPDKSYYKR